LLAQFLQLDLIEAHGRLDEERDGAGVLADGGGEALGQPDVLRDKRQREVGLRAGLFEGAVCLDDLGDVRRQEGGRAADQFQNVGVEAGGGHMRRAFPGGGEYSPALKDRANNQSSINGAEEGSPPSSARFTGLWLLARSFRAGRTRDDDHSSFVGFFSS